jgi:DNA gyrase subunit B
MQRELLTSGMDGAALVLAGGKKFVGDELRELVEVVGPLDHALATLERRGFPLGEFLARRTDGALPVFLVREPLGEHWFASQQKLNEFLAARQAVETEGAENGAAANGANGKPAGDPDFHVLELHEVRTINRLLPALEKFGFTVSDLLPVPAKPGDEPPPRYELADGADHFTPLPVIRELAATLRKNGEKGQEIRRYKGLGEMNAEELWSTTMDPTRRSLLKVTVENAAGADEMFRVLMGEAVEPRREFIERHALEVRNLDYHA